MTAASSTYSMSLCVPLGYLLASDTARLDQLDSSWTSASHPVLASLAPYTLPEYTSRNSPKASLHKKSSPLMDCIPTQDLSTLDTSSLEDSAALGGMGRETLPAGKDFPPCGIQPMLEFLMERKNLLTPAHDHHEVVNHTSRRRGRIGS